MARRDTYQLMARRLARHLQRDDADFDAVVGCADSLHDLVLAAADGAGVIGRVAHNTPAAPLPLPRTAAVFGFEDSLWALDFVRDAGPGDIASAEFVAWAGPVLATLADPERWHTDPALPVLLAGFEQVAEPVEFAELGVHVFGGF